MTFNPTSTLDKSYYYYVNDSIVYKISLIQDDDNCGQQLVITDENGKVDHDANAKVFPCITIDYSYKDSEGNEQQGTRYYFFQDLVRVGDTYADGKFSPNRNHDSNYHGSDDTDKDVSYMTVIQEAIDDSIKSWAYQGATIERIKKQLPYYAVAKVGDTFKVDYYNTATVTSVSNNGMTEHFSDENIWGLWLETLNSQLTKYANNKLAILTKTEGDKTYQKVLATGITLTDSDIIWKEEK